MNSVGPVGPCAMPSPYAEKTLAPLEHMVIIQADPAGQLSAVGTLFILQIRIRQRRWFGYMLTRLVRMPLLL